jgi:hypothetical protein
VIAYVAVPTEELVDVNTWLIVDPSPAVAPTTLGLAETVHAYVVPGILLGVDSKLITAVWPLQMTTGDAVTEGNGLTVTT